MYNPNIPQPSDNISVSQNDILQNFQGANTSFGVNHYAFADLTSNNGKHKQVTMPQVSIPASIVGDLVLYNKSGYGSNSELFMSRDGFGAATEVNLTTAKIAKPTASQNGVSWLPGGILMQWGYSNSVVSSTPITFTTSFPTAVFSINATLIVNASTGHVGTIYINSASLSGFTAIQADLPSSKAGFYWMAIGN